GNCQGNHSIQNNKAHLFIVGVDPCVDPPAEYQPRITPNGNKTKHPHQKYPRRKPQNQPQEKKWATPKTIRIDPTRPPLLQSKDSPPGGRVIHVSPRPFRGGEDTTKTLPQSLRSRNRSDQSPRRTLSQP
ncbi:hypothetical protein, partial [uncultured Gimesia sp.]|uniref:hypothetical protein n=1 Tax=uncultured Gimesia sp. TaxID=1678688 RepID=UPI0030DD3ACF